MKLSLFLKCTLLITAIAQSAQGTSLVLGFHAHNPTAIQDAARTGYTAIRLWDSGTDWRSLEPHQNEWQTQRINEYLSASEAANLTVLWSIGNTPRWAAARPNEKCAYGYGCASEPSDLESWRNYVHKIATTFRGKIECYEPWNEASFPNEPLLQINKAGGDSNQFFTGSIESLVELSKVAYEEIKSADPNACVLSPSFHVSGDWIRKLDLYLQAGGGKYIDAISEHIYFGEEPERAIRMIREIRQILDKHNLRNVAIWNTEVGMPFESDAKQWANMKPEEVVYAMTLRTYLLNASEGIQRIYWYAWDNKISGFFNSNNNYDFGSAAASAAIVLLKDVQSVTCNNTAEQWTCIVTTDKNHFKVAWLSGKNPTPKLITIKTDASRWGVRSEKFSKGQRILLDGRPVIIQD